MVGVPHSTGCARCRERRIKCDEATPDCTQCRRYGRPCPGYKRTFRFQDEGPALERRHQSSSCSSSAARRIHASSSPSTPPSTHTDTSTPTSTSTHDAAAVVRTKALALIQHQNQMEDSNAYTQSYSSTRSPFTTGPQQPALLTAFLRETFPSLLSLQSHACGGDGGEGGGGGTDCASTVATKLLHQTHSPLPSAIDALTTIYHAHHPQIITHGPTRRAALKSGCQVYAAALHQVAAALDDPHRAHSSSTLATIMLLALYETYAQTSPDAWLVHADGVRRLMVSRGVGAHRRGLGGLCYRGVRGVLIALAVEEGRSCFLEEPEWEALSLAGSASPPSSAASSGRSSRSASVGNASREWTGFLAVMERTVVEVVKCPGLLAEGRRFAREGRRGSVVRELRGRVISVRARLVRLVGELCEVVRAGRLAGEGVALVVQGAETAVAVLEALLERVADGDVVRPFRVVSALASVRLCGGGSVRGAAALDRVASSMGMIGTVLVQETRMVR